MYAKCKKCPQVPFHCFWTELDVCNPNLNNLYLFSQVKKFGEMISTLGTDVLAAIATAGPASQVESMEVLSLVSL